MILAAVPAKPRAGQRQHRTDAFAAGLDQMRRYLGDAGRVLRGHAVTDQRVDGGEIIRERFAQSVVGLLRWRVQAHRKLPISTRSPRGLTCLACLKFSAVTTRRSSPSRPRFSGARI
mmetsp:Transcript_1368/g.2735  ORF Transcript_1368/g.2735 Transcript_1368/m.2735 type:complete len:117 (+) Transcript_1368:1343-1693(+)